MSGLPRFTADLPGTGGVLKRAPEDFIVEEIPAYPASGTGEHLFLMVEKRGISTQEMLRRIGRALDLPTTAIGVAGQKDQQSISRQVISVPAAEMARASTLRLEGVTVLSAARHGNKLRTGHLRGNRFIVTVRGVVPDAEARAKAIVDRLSASWLPNYFGAQRFGRGDENVRDGRRLMLGQLRVQDKFKRRFLVSAYQAGLYNRYLAARMESGDLHRAVTGDVLQRTQTGGLFWCQPEELVLSQARIERREVVPTGPMFGHKMFAPLAGSPAEERERAVLAAEGITVEHFAAFSKIAEGTRRALLARIEAPSVKQEEDRLVLSFALPSGSYATVLLDEVMKSDTFVGASSDTRGAGRDEVSATDDDPDAGSDDAEG